MPTRVFGLPAHILLIHAVVVLVPLTCVAVVLHALWPTARKRLGIVTPLLGLVCIVLMPVTINAGNWLAARIPATKGTALAKNIDHHRSLANNFWPWVAGLFVVTVAVWVIGRWRDGTSVPGTGRAGAARTVSSPVAMVVAVVAIAISVVNLVEVYRVGESGSHSVWCSGKSAYCPSGG